MYMYVHLYCMIYVFELYAHPGGNSERQNTLVECVPQGRNATGDADDIQIVKDIQQLGDNPLLILDGFQ